MHERHAWPVKYSSQLSRERSWRGCSPCGRVKSRHLVCLLNSTPHQWWESGLNNALMAQKAPPKEKPLLCLHVKRARLPEHLHAPSGHSGEEARSQVPRRVDGVAAVQTHGHGDGHDDQADAQWLHAFGSANVLPVSDGQDAQDEGAGADHLREETSIRTWWKDLLVSSFVLVCCRSLLFSEDVTWSCSRDLCPLLLSLSLLQGFPFPLLSGSITTYVGMSCLWVCLLRKHTQTLRPSSL